LEDTLSQIYRDVNPSVVNIQVVVDASSVMGGLPDIPGFPGEPSEPGMPFQQEGQGSGFVWDKEGHIVTNNHVVQGAQEITVTFYDDTSVPGTVVGTDPHSDLAVVQVDLPSSQLQPIQVADSSQIRVGQLAVAIGNPFGLEGTMTVGFVSALGRSLPVSSGNLMAPSYTIPDIIQTDAPINPGNSGGVLVDDGGQLIGVPTAIESPVRANAGVGFAVPSAIVQKVVPALIEDGYYEHAWIGISGTTLRLELAEAMGLDPQQRGVLVSEVIAGSPADEAGLLGSDGQTQINGVDVGIGGDVIVAIDGKTVREFDDLVTYLARSTSAGDTVILTVLRDGSEETIRVQLAARPGEEGLRAQADPSQPRSKGAVLGIVARTMTSELAEAMDLPTTQTGTLVVTVVDDGPADEAGLQGSDTMVELDGREVEVGGDIITGIDGQPVKTMEDLLAYLETAEPEQVVTLTLLRDGSEMFADVTLGQR
jgi:S1-C subfamily serine protease